jgi:hypothetical protein
MSSYDARPQLMSLLRAVPQCSGCNLEIAMAGETGEFAARGGLRSLLGSLGKLRWASHVGRR